MITIPKGILDLIVAHAKATYPNEACGILAGPEKTPCLGDVFYPMTNLDGSSISYFMDPKEQLTVLKELRQKGLSMRGIFHSHVATAAYPSQKDIRLAYYQDVSYLILSLVDIQQPKLRSFRIMDEMITEEEIH